jgi:predicted ATPase
MPNYVLTGTPGAGKTVILRQLESNGYAVVEEAATDVIALDQAQAITEPHLEADFVDKIVRLQRSRELAAAFAAEQAVSRLSLAGESPLQAQSEVVFFDRSVICTLALSRFLGVAVSSLLAAEVERVVGEQVYSPRVFFVRGLGFVAPTEARRITLEHALVFEKVHEETYRELGFELVEVPPGSVEARVALIEREVSALKV